MTSSSLCWYLQQPSPRLAGSRKFPFLCPILLASFSGLSFAVSNGPYFSFKVASISDLLMLPICLNISLVDFQYFQFLLRWTVSSVIRMMGGNDVITVCLFALKQTEQFLNEIQGGTVYSELSLSLLNSEGTVLCVMSAGERAGTARSFTDPHRTVAALICLQHSKNIIPLQFSYKSSQSWLQNKFLIRLKIRVRAALLA